jgi:hypothetical protein
VGPLLLFGRHPLQQRGSRQIGHGTITELRRELAGWFGRYNSWRPHEAQTSVNDLVIDKIASDFYSPETSPNGAKDDRQGSALGPTYKIKSPALKVERWNINGRSCMSPFHARRIRNVQHSTFNIQRSTLNGESGRFGNHSSRSSKSNLGLLWTIESKQFTLKVER